MHRHDLLDAFDSSIHTCALGVRAVSSGWPYTCLHTRLHTCIYSDFNNRAAGAVKELAAQAYRSLPLQTQCQISLDRHNEKSSWHEWNPTPIKEIPVFNTFPFSEQNKVTRGSKPNVITRSSSSDQITTPMPTGSLNAVCYAVRAAPMFCPAGGG